MNNYVVYQYRTKDTSHLFGNSRIINEVDPYLDHPVRVDVLKAGAPLFALRLYDKCKMRDFVNSVHHFADPLMGFIGHVRTRGKKIISINDAIGPKYYAPHWTERFMYSGYPKFDAVMTISEASQTAISDVFHIPKEKIYVAQPGVNTKRFVPIANNIRDLYHIPKDAFLFGTLGNTRTHKNPLFARKVLDSLSDSGVNAYFIRAGYYDQTDEYQVEGMKQLEQVESPHFINLHYQKDLVLFYNSLDCYIAPSLEEGFDLPVLEALACGVPVIASRIPAHEEILEWYYPLYNTESSPGGVAMLMMAMKGCYTKDECVSFAKKFSWKKTADKITEAYDAVYKS